MPNSSPDRDTDTVDVRKAESVAHILRWYRDNARPLPWRAAGRSPWGVLVSEVMLQQTQVSRVEPRWREWMQRWPTPGHLSAEPVGEAIRAWQGLGYPRRALRLHAAAGTIVQRHGGQVPGTFEELHALPGIGQYTAAAVLAFAFGASIPVLDTNVRRVFSRWLAGSALPRTASIGRAEREAAAQLLPPQPHPPLWSVAVMELGALVCTARGPACADCPVRADCAWRAAGYPPGASAVRQAAFEGSDRQARGFMMRAVSASGRSREATLIEGWREQRGRATGAAEQAERALASLHADGLLARADGFATLP